MRAWMVSFGAPAVGLLFGFAGCTGGGGMSDAGPDGPPPSDVQVPDVLVDAPAPPPNSFCALPGSRIATAAGTLVIPKPSGVTEPDLTFMHLPVGYCVHYFATIACARNIRFAPGGELFVSSPSTNVAGGAAAGAGAIFDIPDDNGDGYGDTNILFQGGLSQTEGILFANDNFYYQDQTQIMSLPYTSGERMNTGSPTSVVNITVYSSSTHWPKTLDVADDGTIFVSNGGDQSALCMGMPPSFEGGILAIDGSPGGKEIAFGFRNPQYLRCQRGHDNCFVDELTLDGSGGNGGREKMALFGLGEDWGFPCCASFDVPFTTGGPTPDCSSVMQETVAFKVSETPFGLDFEPGIWPAPYTHSAFIAMHGAFGSWTGERVVAIQTDPTTGKPIPSSDVDGTETGGMSDFITGYDDNTQSHGRPTDVTFAKDGRMFVADDTNGVIYWVAPETLTH